MTQVINEGKAILIKDTAIDPRFHRAKSVVSSFRTAMCVPLLGHNGRSLGMIQLDRRTGRKGFKAGDLDLLAALSVPVGVAVENHQLLKERASWAAAREIQLALLPHGRPQIRRLCVLGVLSADPRGRRRPLRLYCGGTSGLDQKGPVRWAVTVGDVAGKGMAAALVVAGLARKYGTRCELARSSRSPCRGHRRLCDQGVGGRFVTMVIADIDARSTS